MFKPTRRNNVLCHAIDDTRYKHTVAPPGETDGGSSRLLSDFLTYFPDLSTTIKDREGILRLVSLSTIVREWYQNWSRSEANATAFPDWLDKTSEKDLLAFDRISDERVKYGELQKQWNNRIKIASDALRAAVKAVDKEKNDYVLKMSPLFKINSITVLQLPTKDQAMLASIGDDLARKEKTRELVLNYQKLLKASLDSGQFKDPFV